MISDDLSHRDPPPVCLPSPLLSTHPPTQSTLCCFCNAVPLFLTTHNPHESRIPMAAIEILHWFVYRLSFSAPTLSPTAPTLVHFLHCSWSSLVLGAHMISDDRDPPPVCLPSPLLGTHPPTHQEHPPAESPRPSSNRPPLLHPPSCALYFLQATYCSFCFYFFVFLFLLILLFSQPVKSSNE